jgi:hypothetical protein
MFELDIAVIFPVDVMFPTANEPKVPTDVIFA